MVETTTKPRRKAGLQTRRAGKTEREPAGAAARKTKRKTAGRVTRNKAPKSPARGRAAGGKGQAGRRGEDVRSDAHVTVTLGRSGGIDLRVTSRVDVYYGESIRETAASVLAACGVKHARVDIDDKGAVPFVLAARIEAALRRAGVAAGDARPERAFARKAATGKDRPRRSRLYLPGNEPKFMLNAGIHKPDGIILDLEDSVHPDEKDAARLVVRNALRAVDFLGAERMVRINQMPRGLEDVDAVAPESPDLVLIPKVETADDVRLVRDRIERARNRGRDGGAVWLMPIIESALGVENAFEIAGAADTVVALTIGLEDYTADLGVRKTREGLESHFARSRLVNAARAAGVQAIDSVYGDVGDMSGLETWARRSRDMGFEGMGCIHPRQIRVIHGAFAPTSGEIQRALEIVEAFERARRRGLGVVSIGTRMVDPPVVLRAQRVVDAARRAGLLDEK
ncbi:MAG: aldolase/citrate lyase family protein [Candidatus Krumholzibacteriia bacterium]